MADVISLDAIRAQRNGCSVAILSQRRAAPVPGADVRLPDGGCGAYVCQTLSGRHFIARDDGVTVSVPSDWLGDGPEAA